MPATAAKVVPLKPLSIGRLIDKLSDLREERRALEAQDKLLVASFEELQIQLIDMMEREGVDKSTGKKASAGLKTTTRYNIKDDVAFFAYIHRHKYYHLLERRPSVSGCAELFKDKGGVPGIEPFSKKTINLTNL